MPDQIETVPPEKKGSGCLKGCLIALVIVVLLALIGGFMIYKYGKIFAVSVISSGINQTIDSSGLPEQEKVEVKAQVQRVTDGVSDGSISNEQLSRIMTDLAESPVFNSMFVFAIESLYIEKSGLTDEEKADGQVQLRRFTQGILDGAIDEKATDEVMRHVADQDADGGWKMREKVTDEELSAAIAAAKAAADEAGVPAEVGEIDLSEEVRKVIDGVLVGQ